MVPRLIALLIQQKWMSGFSLSQSGTAAQLRVGGQGRGGSRRRPWLQDGVAAVSSRGGGAPWARRAPAKGGVRVCEVARHREHEGAACRQQREVSQEMTEPEGPGSPCLGGRHGSLLLWLAGNRVGGGKLVGKVGGR